MIHVTRELLNDWLQKLQGVPVDSPAMQVAHSIVALLNDDVPALPAIPVGPPAGYKMTASFSYADMIQAGWSDNLLIEYGHMKPVNVVDVPAIPVQPAPNYRIQIEDGAWVGTLDEWRALLKLSGKRAVKPETITAKLMFDVTIKDGEWEGTLGEWRKRVGRIVNPVGGAK